MQPVRDDPEREYLTLNIPLSPGWTAELRLPARMTGVEWVQMWTVLEAVRPGIVDSDPESWAALVGSTDGIEGGVADG